MKTTQLTLKGISPDEITQEFLIEIMDAADESGLSVESVSVDKESD